MKKNKFKINKFDIIVAGAGVVGAYFIYKAVKGGFSGNSGGTGTGGNTGGTPPPPPPAPFPSIAYPYAGSASGVNAFVYGWEMYAIPSCFDCSWRYQILKETQEKLDNIQLKQVSDALRQKTGKSMYEQMSDMWWFGGPYSNNKAEQLYSRVQSI
jgi:hypothetical protein